MLLSHRQYHNRLNLLVWLLSPKEVADVKHHLFFGQLTVSHDGEFDPVDSVWKFVLDVGH